jgi:hypothetical protein
MMYCNRRINAELAQWSGLVIFCISLIALLTEGCAGVDRIASGNSRWGEYGGDLDQLRRFYFPPAIPGESNHLIELSQFRGDGSWKDFLANHGLTNNHALIVASHGKAIPCGLGSCYAYSPEKSGSHAHDLDFSAEDLASVLGPAAREIHNIVIAGCDTEGIFDPNALRRWFVNATNITHAPREKLASETAFVNALIYRSRDIKFLFGMPDSFVVGRFDHRPAKKPTTPSPYIADLYWPNGTKPFRTQIAGRELLKPEESAPALTLTVPWPNFPMQAWPREKQWRK